MDRPVRIAAGEVALEGGLRAPEGASGLVIFAHGSGSGRFSPRNRMVARAVESAGMATLLLDLLAPEEEAADARGGQLRFDIGLLANRLVAAYRWSERQPEVRGVAVGYFGASTGAAAALVAAAQRPEGVAAIVSRGGRPDLAGEALGQVCAPTLLIVGGNDEPVIGMNQEAMGKLRCEKELVIVPGATHLFEEAGALEEVARLATDWFLGKFRGAART